MSRLSIGAGEIRMQEAIIAQQILRQQAVLQRQAGDERNITVSSDTIHSDVQYATIGHGFEVEDVPLGDVINVVSDNLSLGEINWVFHLERYPDASLTPSCEVLGSAEVGGSSSSTITSDRLDEETRAELRKEQGEIYARIEDARSNLNARIYNRLKQRFEFLFEPENEQQIRVSPGSVRQLLKFLIKERKLRSPGIFITDKRNIKAIWQASERQIFWIEFEPNGDVTYLAFFLNSKRSDGIERVSALSTIEDVLDRAKEIGVLKWMKS